MLHDLSFSDSFHARVFSQTQLISHMVSEEAILQISYGLKQLSRISFAAIFDSLLFDSLLFDSLLFVSLLFDSLLFDSLLFVSLLFDSLLFDSLLFDSLLFDCAIHLSFGALSNEIQGFVLVDRSYDLSMYDRLNNWLDWY